jgi:hypothetical protein
MFCCLSAHSVALVPTLAGRAADAPSLPAAMPPKALITITMQEDALVATTVAGNEVLRIDQVDTPGREMKQALRQALGHANFVMVTPGAEKLVAGGNGIAEQFGALAAARQRAASRMHPQWHRVDDSMVPVFNARSRCPVKKDARYGFDGGYVFIDEDGTCSAGSLLGSMLKIPYDLGEEIQGALNAFAESERVPLAERRRSRSPTRLQARLVTAVQRVRDWRP